jgi:hypothetical protein
MSEFLGLPLRTYQKIETGTLPTEATMRLITQRLGVSEASLVQLPDVAPPKPAATTGPTSNERLRLLGCIILELTHLDETKLAGIFAFIRAAGSVGVKSKNLDSKSG